MRDADVLRAELQHQRGIIDNAYWTFTRTARGKPPILVVPEAYKRVRELEAELRELTTVTGCAILEG